jgi:hypothetical protein
MGIVGVEPRQLAPTVGTTGSGSTDSPAPSPTITDLPASTRIDGSSPATAVDSASPTTIDIDLDITSSTIDLDIASSAIDIDLDIASFAIDIDTDTASPTIIDTIASTDVVHVMRVALRTSASWKHLVIVAMDCAALCASAS